MAHLGCAGTWVTVPYFDNYTVEGLAWFTAHNATFIGYDAQQPRNDDDGNDDDTQAGVLAGGGWSYG
jgi:hypothetical protein